MNYLTTFAEREVVYVFESSPWMHVLGYVASAITLAAFVWIVIDQYRRRRP
jgi:hypothetical protein